MILAATGHRPEKLPDAFWGEPEHYVNLMNQIFEQIGVERVIVGMAAGFDLAVGFSAFCLDVPYVCAVPWRGHSPRKSDTALYQTLLRHADRIVYVHDEIDYPGPWVYQKRNEWMVDHAEMILSCWDGSKGGTYNCIQYSHREGKQVLNIDPITQEMKWVLDE